MKRKIFFRYLFWVLEIHWKVFSVFGCACKSIFLKNIFLRLALNVKHFTGKCQKNNLMLQLSISKYLYTSYMDIHYKIPITKNMNIYTSKFYITMIEVPIYKNHNPNTTFMVIHPSLDVPFY